MYPPNATGLICLPPMYPSVFALVYSHEHIPMTKSHTGRRRLPRRLSTTPRAKQLHVFLLFVQLFSLNGLDVLSKNYLCNFFL